MWYGSWRNRILSYPRQNGERKRDAVARRDSLYWLFYLLPFILRQFSFHKWTWHARLFRHENQNRYMPSRSNRIELKETRARFSIDLPSWISTSTGYKIGFCGFCGFWNSVLRGKSISNQLTNLKFRSRCFVSDSNKYLLREKRQIWYVGVLFQSMLENYQV